MRESSRHRTGMRVVLLGAACLVLAMAGCIKTPTKSPLMQQAPDLVDLTAMQLRQKVYDFADRFARVVESAADTIMESTQDPEVRERALLWKLEAITEVHRAGFKTDPLAGLMDMAVLCGQMVAYFHDGAGSDLFGPHQPIAIEAAESLNRDVWLLGNSLTLSGDPATAREAIAKFVAAHPIRDQLFLRDSDEDLWTQFGLGRKAGAGAAIGGINEALDDLSKRMTLYAAHLPREARWHAELTAMRMLRKDPLDDAFLAVESLAESHELFAQSVADALQVITTEREATMGELDDLTRHSMNELDRQRLDTITALQLERQAIVHAMEAQTQVALQRLQEERVATMGQLEQMLEATVDSAFDRFTHLADRLFFRALILVIILAGTLLLVAILFMGLLRQRPARGSEPA
ncbi:MAG: hypothetical protein O7C74_08920 [Acidobacteria bacterium]|nr:hypothetical protein [Acidobacteriota bacterium]